MGRKRHSECLPLSVWCFWLWSNASQLPISWQSGSCVLVGEKSLAPNKISSDEVNVKRERLTQIVLVIVGLVNLALIYFLYMDLRHSSWLLEQKNECEPMFLSFFIPVGVFLLMAARRPSEHRSMIALADWCKIYNSLVMVIINVEVRVLCGYTVF